MKSKNQHITNYDMELDLLQYVPSQGSLFMPIATNCVCFLSPIPTQILCYV
jgi:hypothetical protein